MTSESAEALQRTNFTAIDTGIVVVYLGLSLVIGLMVKKYARNMTAYIGADRKIGTWLGVATMMGTEMGLVTVMFSAQKGFGGGFAAFHIAAIAGVATLLVGLTGFIVVPLRKAKVLTIPEFYEKRFDRKTRVLGGIILAFAGILNMGLFLKVGSIFIVNVTGLSADGSALYLVMAALLILVLAYTTMGGMISVILTDYIQFVVLSVGILIATWMAIDQVGWSNMFDTVRDEMGDKGFNPLVAESKFGPSYVVWMFISAGLIGSAVWPTAVSRALAMESTQAVKRQYLWSSISFTVRFMIPYVWGIAAFVYIKTSADGADLNALILGDGTKASDADSLRAMPLYMGRLLPPILIGVITAAMIAAFMSTHDSYFLCWSSVITQDVVAPLLKKPLSEKARVKLTRIIILVIGVYVYIWGVTYSGGEDVWDYMAISGAIFFNGALGVLIGGLYWKRASRAGAFAALFGGMTAIFGLAPIREMLGLLVKGPDGKVIAEHMTGAHFGLISVGLSLTLMIVFSLLLPDRDGDELKPESDS